MTCQIRVTHWKHIMFGGESPEIGNQLEAVTIINLVIFFLLTALTTVFVGSEFALVKVCSTRVEQSADKGNESAKIVKRMIANLGYYLLARQLSITITSLDLGWLGEPTFEKLLHLFSNLSHLPSAVTTTIPFVVPFIVVICLHVVLGELIPKSVAVQHTEKSVLTYAKPLYYFGNIMKPLVWLMNGSAQAIVRMFGVDLDAQAGAMSEEGVKIITNNSYNGGETDQTELNYIRDVLSLNERYTKDIIVPHIQIVTLSESFNVGKLLNTIKEYQFIRYPVTEGGDRDHVKSFIDVEKSLVEYASGRTIKISNYICELPMISEATRISGALVSMQRERVHIDLIVDEYGGAADILTIGDIPKEIVGEIRNEFDDDKVNDIVKLEEGIYQISERILSDDLHEKFDVTFEDSEDIDAIGGQL